jgi:hypothetical protein
MDGKWGPKTRAAIVTVKKGAKGKLSWILQAPLYTEGHSPGSLDSIFGKGTETALANQKEVIFQLIGRGEIYFH